MQVERLGQVEDAVKKRVLAREVGEGAVGKDALHLLGEVVPFVLAPEVVEHEEAAVEQVAAEDGDFLIGEGKIAGLDDVDERVAEEHRVGDLENLRIGIDLERSHLLEPPGKVQVGVGKIRGPSPRAAVAAIVRVVADADEREDIALEARRVFPRRCLVGVLGEIARGEWLAGLLRADLLEAALLREGASDHGEKESRRASEHERRVARTPRPRLSAGRPVRRIDGRGRPWDGRGRGRPRHAGRLAALAPDGTECHPYPAVPDRCEDF